MVFCNVVLVYFIFSFFFLVGVLDDVASAPPQNLGKHPTLLFALFLHLLVQQGLSAIPTIYLLSAAVLLVFHF